MVSHKKKSNIHQVKLHTNDYEVNGGPCWKATDDGRFIFYLFVFFFGVFFFNERNISRKEIGAGLACPAVPNSFFGKKKINEFKKKRFQETTTLVVLIALLITNNNNNNNSNNWRISVVAASVFFPKKEKNEVKKPGWKLGKSCCGSLFLSFFLFRLFSRRNFGDFALKAVGVLSFRGFQRSRLSSILAASLESRPGLRLLLPSVGCPARFWDSSESSTRPPFPSPSGCS